MSFENTAQEEREKSPKKGQVAHALGALTLGIVNAAAKKGMNPETLGTAVEEMGKMKEALDRFDSDGSLGAMIESGAQKLFDKLKQK